MRNFSFGKNQITDIGAIELANELVDNKSLQVLRQVFSIFLISMGWKLIDVNWIGISVYENQITDKGMIAIAESLVGNTVLITIVCLFILSQ